MVKRVAMSKKKDSFHLKSLEAQNLLGNFTAYDPNGDFLFNCDSKKARWYVKRNLATWINEEKTHFKLNFIPKGNGNRNLGKYFTEYIKNQCVICGTSEHLTKHHVVPSCYKKHFPEMCKSNDHFDVLLICSECHETIEHHYDHRKKELHKPHKGELENEYNHYKELNSLIRTAQKHVDYLDDARKEIMAQKATKINPSITTFDQLLNAELIDIGGSLDNTICQRIVRDEQDNLRNFIISWRELFLEYGQPKFLPNGWLEEYLTHFKF
jgi:hypothetical protein